MSGIIINIKAGATFEESSVSATGQLVHVIVDSERASFGIGSEDELKKAVGKYFDEEPTNAYLKSKTPWNDLYESYGWPQVQTVLEPKTAQILEVNTKPTILNTNTLTNESDFPATFTSKISKDVTDTVSNTWSNSSKVSFQQMIKYKFSFLGIGAGGETTFGFDQEWGRSETVTKESTVGMETGVSVKLKPGESAIVELSANAGTMRVRITYEAYLKGHTACNYSSGYEGHHFWGIPIGNVIRDSNKVQIVEDIDVGFYCNSTAKVKNAETNEDMKFYFVDFPDEPPIE